MTNINEVRKEKTFESELEERLLSNGWLKGDDKNYDKALALYPIDLIAFVKETQPAEWEKFRTWHNGDTEQMFLSRVADQLDRHGTLHVLRHGFKDRDARFFFSQSRPAHGANPLLLSQYHAIRVTIVRQVHYSLHNDNSIDIVLFTNGLPVATAELKTDLTQNIQDAVRQYRYDRSPKDSRTKELEPLLAFKTRALVHFAVSTDEVETTTKLEGS